MQSHGNGTGINAPHAQELLRKGYLSGKEIPELARELHCTEEDVRRQLIRMRLMFDATAVEQYGMAVYGDEDE